MYMYIGDYLDNQPSFFDSDEEKEKKRKFLNSMSAEEKEEIRQQMEDMESLPPPPEVTASEILDYTPSIFDTPELYKHKYLMLESWGLAEGIRKPTEVHLLPEQITPRPRAIPREIKEKLQTLNTAKPLSMNGFIYKNGELIFCGNDQESGTVIGNFWITIKTEKIIVHETVNEQNIICERRKESHWEVEILCMGKTYISILTVKDLWNEVEVLKVTQDRAYLETEKECKKLYKRYINQLIQNESYTKEYEYASTGWTKIDGSWYYLTNQGIIGHPSKLVKAKVPYQFRYDIQNVGSKTVFEEFLKLRELCPYKRENSTFLMHYTCLSTLTTLFQEVGHGINFITALIGSTNSQKTSSAIIFSRIFDRTPQATPDIRFNSTEVAIMEKMESYGDAILLVDDFLPYNNHSDMKEQMKKSELLIRSYGDRVPRKRSKVYAQTTGVAEFSRVKGCCIITGEVFDTNSESSSTRVIQLNFAQGDVDLQLLSFFQNNLLNVPTFVYDFICYIQDNIECVFEIIKMEIEYVRKCNILEISIPRFKDTLGILNAETKLFYSYATDRGFMTQAEALELREYDMTLIQNLIVQNELNAKIKSPATILCSALQRSIIDKTLYCISNEEAKLVENFENIVIEQEEYLCVLPETLWNVYCNYCKEFRREVIYNSYRELSALLKKENAISIKEESGKVRASHKLSGAKTNKRFFYIKKTVFKELYKAFECF